MQDKGYFPRDVTSSLLFIENFLYCIIFDIILYHQGLDFDDMSSFFPCEIDEAIQFIDLGYGAQAPKIVIL